MSATEQLYMFYVGGRAPGANIEVHDLQFVAATSPEAAYPELRRRWYGIPSSLHIDTWSRVTRADGHDVFPAAHPPTHDIKLWFLNMGSYRKGFVPELHACGLFVARTAAEAKSRAKQTRLAGEMLQHTDDQVDVDDCIQIVDLGGLHVHLTPNSTETVDEQPEFQGYLPIAD